PPNDSSSRGRGDKGWDRGSRGRGRGQNQRGFRGGSYHDSYGAGNGNLHGGGSYPLPTYPAVQQSQYSFNPAASYYTPVASYHVPPQNFSYYPNTYQAQQPQAPSYQYAAPPQFSQTHGYTPQPQHGRPHHPSNRYESPPVAMGPPIRMGFGNENGRAPTSYGFPENSMNSGQADPRSTFQEDSPFHHHQRGREPGPNSIQVRFRGGRGHHSSRGRHESGNSFKESSRLTQVAPAVPQFGNPIPGKPPNSEPLADQLEAKMTKKKKKRRVNQLGLTPKAEEHVSSSEEEDEEAILAATVEEGTNGQLLQFTYKGQTSTLQSSTDIASWIEERKKQFPTAARKAEKDAARQKMNREKQQVKMKEKRAAKLKEKQQRSLDREKQAAAEKAKLKVEKLRKRLEKEERRIAKAESETLKRSASPDINVDQSREAKRRRIQPQDNIDDSADSAMKVEPSTTNSVREVVKNEQFADEAQASVSEVKDHRVASSIPDPLTPTSQPALTEEFEEKVKLDAVILQHSQDQHQVLGQSATDHQNVSTTGCVAVEGNAANATISDDVSMSSDDDSMSSDDDSDDSDDDWTSSSGSDSPSASDSNVDAPETASIRHPDQRVPYPEKDSKKLSDICRDFLLNKGRCKRGKKCKWIHRFPEQGKKRAAKETTSSRSQLKSLHQRLVEQELEMERLKRAPQKNNTKRATQ
ncbi:MAG: hypothetical protein Q9228_007142, partial [Teloschistes exilis]